MSLIGKGRVFLAGREKKEFHEVEPGQRLMFNFKFRYGCPDETFNVTVEMNVVIVLCVRQHQEGLAHCFPNKQPVFVMKRHNISS